MGSLKPDTSVAVFFMEGNTVSRQMLFSEFEAFLDGYVGLSDMADKEVKAVYVVLNAQLQVEALVFFLIYFDDEGRADPEWNVPIERLASISGSGPDMGGGAIRLSCRSQCSINWHQKELWDPDMTPGSSHFAAIKKAVEQNRLGFKKAKVEEVVPTLQPVDVENESIPTVTAKVEEKGVTPPADDAEHRLKLARLIKNQRLRIKTLESHREAQKEEFQRQASLQSQAYKAKINSLELSVEKLKVLNEQLQEKLLSRNEQFLGLQDKVSTQTNHLSELEEKLKHAEVAEVEGLEKQKLEAELVILKEQLDRREVESVYREEKMELLRAELEEHKAAADEAERDSMMTKLKELEVVFVAYHAGAGHVTVPFTDIYRYVESPLKYVAAKCYVTEEVYRKWLDHQDNPVCGHKKENGELCGEGLEVVGNPGDFEVGSSDRCKRHQGD
ncbi:hypothetical protein [Alkalimarinus sediminis]|uniref:Uncharacterized protein n=1 Tax=Alkalimarinus sediminis TaxID=1632866 RepID=A0A9E8KQD5_9ALTE|nr:hypothetical protein [Alkalimarinus sediminis]UZW75709.1 hypothetical protein NNL22_03720 [Alkalimarinus sediminis]